MANKSRPKKSTVPYTKYVAGEGFFKVRLSKKRDNHPNNSYNQNDHNEDILTIDSTISNGINKLKIHAGKDTIDDSKGATNFTDQMKLPLEIQKLIINYTDPLPDVNYLLVCHYWYWQTLPMIYFNPSLNSKNFQAFVNSITFERKKRMGDLVHELNLSTILQSGKNSFVSKLLRRCSANLEKFTAPQTSFGYAPLMSLKSCHSLIYLDLGLVSETVKLNDLFAAIKNFENLTHLSFPRSSINCDNCDNFHWPKNLKYLKLSGGFTNEFVQNINWPQTIKTLEFSDCPQLDEHSFYTILDQVGGNLKHLFFYYPMPSFHDNSLDYVFRYCPNLLSIQIMVDYCTKWAFSEYMLSILENGERPLKTIYLECSGQLGMATKIHPDDFTIALMEHRLPLLKNIRVSSRLGWDMKSSEVEDLVNALEEQDGSLFVHY